MSVICVRDNTNNRWKRNAKKNNKQNKTRCEKKEKKQRQKWARDTEATVKGWELNDFAVRLS